ncbi:MAG: hypothetical protein EWM47_11530 [Anaerolineaceae bacterium]|nr:MAG: hypothetical protein EWM47_11530 [Anaerolineaceae bacterium]
MNKSYNDRTHRYGRIWILTAFFILLMVPASICVYYNAWPPLTAVLKGLLGVAPIFWTVGTIEVFTYGPMLGTAGSYLAFVTGNITNMKAPSALNAMENAGVKPGTEEGEVVSTIAIATSSIITTIIISIGVMLLSLLAPLLNSPRLKPAFDNILPALFGGLAVVYISKNWKLSLAPMIFMIVLFLLVPSLASSVGVLVPVGVIISLGAARIMYKKNFI